MGTQSNALYGRGGPVLEINGRRHACLHMFLYYYFGYITERILENRIIKESVSLLMEDEAKDIHAHFY